MRKTHVCPKCRHNRILSIAVVPDKTATGDPGQFNIARIVFDRIPWLSVTSTAGDVSAAVCRACGYAEFYVDDAASIPIDGKHISELVGPEQSGPYR